MRMSHTRWALAAISISECSSFIGTTSSYDAQGALCTFIFTGSMGKGSGPAIQATRLSLFAENPRRIVLGNLHSCTRTPVRHRGVGKRA